MRILMSGQIYIKREPTIIEIEPENIEPGFLFTKDGLEPLDQEFYSTVEAKDYRGCTSFWVSVVNEDGIDMVESVPKEMAQRIDFNYDGERLNVTEIPMPSQGARIHFSTACEMEDEFMPLTEFLAQAHFVGRKFRLKGNTPIFDAINNGNDRTVLYATDNIILIENYNYQLGHMFEIMRSDKKEELEDGLCEENTSLDESYKNKALTYAKVLDYLVKNKRKKL